LKVLLLHLLKWRAQPERQCGGWRGSILESRLQLADVLDDNPSLRAYSAECLPGAYSVVRRKALDETGLCRLPEACPWTIEQILDKDFLP